MSVVNKMLRDIDSRRSADEQPASAGAPRTDMESNTVIVNDSGKTGSGGLSLGALLAFAAIVLAGSAGPWWYLSENGFLPRNLEEVKLVALGVMNQQVPADKPVVTLNQPAVAATLVTVPSSPIGSAQADETSISQLAPLTSRVETVTTLSSPSATVRPESLQPEVAIGQGPVIFSSTPVTPSTSRLNPINAAGAQQAVPISQKPINKTPPTFVPVAVTVPIPTPTEAAPQPEQAQSPVLEALAQAQSLWKSGSRQASMGLLREALAAAERANPVGTPSADHSELVLLARELARMDLILGQPGSALALLRRLEPALFGFADVWAIRGNAAQRLGRHQESATAYLMALKLRPNEPRWMLGAAVSLAAQGQIGKATELAEKARISGVLSLEVATYLRQLGVNLREI